MIYQQYLDLHPSSSWDNSITCSVNGYISISCEYGSLSVFKPNWNDADLKRNDFSNRELIFYLNFESPNLISHRWSSDGSWYIVGHGRLLQIFSVQMSFQCVASVSLEHEIRVVDVILLSNSSLHIISAGSSNGVEIFLFNDSEHVVHKSALLLQSYIISTLSFSMGAEYLAVAAIDGHIGIWDTQKFLKQQSTASNHPADWLDVIPSVRITSVVFSPTVMYLVVALRDGSIHVFINSSLNFKANIDKTMQWVRYSKCQEYVFPTHYSKAICSTFCCWIPTPIVEDINLILVSGRREKCIEVIDIKGGDICETLELPQTEIRNANNPILITGLSATKNFFICHDSAGRLTAFPNGFSALTTMPSEIFNCVLASNKYGSIVANIEDEKTSVRLACEWLGCNRRFIIRAPFISKTRMKSFHVYNEDEEEVSYTTSFLIFFDEKIIVFIVGPNIYRILKSSLINSPDDGDVNCSIWDIAVVPVATAEKVMIKDQYSIFMLHPSHLRNRDLFRILIIDLYDIEMNTIKHTIRSHLLDQNILMDSIQKNQIHWCSQVSEYETIRISCCIQVNRTNERKYWHWKGTWHMKDKKFMENEFIGKDSIQ